MDMSVMHLEDTLAQIRAGKANVHILDDLRVNSYGSMVPINNVAAITTPDSRTIAIKPWEKNMFPVIEKAIIDSTIGIMPENNGEVIRLGIPPLTRTDPSSSPSSVPRRPRRLKWPFATHAAKASTN